MFEIGDTVEVNYEAIPQESVRSSYRYWMGSHTTLTISHIASGRGYQGADELGFWEFDDLGARYHARYFKLAGPPRTVRALSMKIIRELTQ